MIQGVTSTFGVIGAVSDTFCTGAGVFGETGATGAGVVTGAGVPLLIACRSATFIPDICSCTLTVGAIGAGAVGAGVTGVSVATGVTGVLACATAVFRSSHCVFISSRAFCISWIVAIL